METIDQITFELNMAKITFHPIKHDCFLSKDYIPLPYNGHGSNHYENPVNASQRTMQHVFKKTSSPSFVLGSDFVTVTSLEGITQNLFRAARKACKHSYTEKNITFEFALPEETTEPDEFINTIYRVAKSINATLLEKVQPEENPQSSDEPDKSEESDVLEPENTQVIYHYGNKSKAAQKRAKNKPKKKGTDNSKKAKRAAKIRKQQGLQNG